MKLRDLPRAEKPRERLLKLGAESLSMQELLEILLSQGNRQESVSDIANKIVYKYQNWNGINAASIGDLKSVTGVGNAKAAQIKAAFEFGKRFYAENIEPQSDSILNTQQAYLLCQKYFKHKKKEHLMLFCLDVRGRLIAEPEVLSVGTLECSLIHPREIFHSAITNHAARILLAHNHPSGSAEPSDADLHVTEQINAAGHLMGIQLLDHLVIGSAKFVSIRKHSAQLFELSDDNVL